MKLKDLLPRAPPLPHPRTGKYVKYRNCLAPERFAYATYFSRQGVTRLRDSIHGGFTSDVYFNLLSCAYSIHVCDLERWFKNRHSPLPHPVLLPLPFPRRRFYTRILQADSSDWSVLWLKNNIKSCSPLSVHQIKDLLCIYVKRFSEQSPLIHKQIHGNRLSTSSKSPVREGETD